VRAAVAARRATDANPGDPFRGLYLDDAEVDRVLERGPETGGGWRPAASVAPGDAESCRVLQVARRFGLDDLDLGILLVALAPDLDPRYEQLYGYLHDDVTRRRASTGLALELCGASIRDVAARARVARGHVLVGYGLLEIDELDRPFLTRTLRVPDAVASFLMGADEVGPEIRERTRVVPARRGALTSRIENARARGINHFYLHEAVGTSGTEAAAAALGESPHVTVDLSGVPPGEAERLAQVAVRDARLRDAVLLAGPIDALKDAPRALRILLDDAIDVVLAGSMSWDPAWTTQMPLIVRVGAPSRQEREDLWRASVNGGSADLPDVAAMTSQFRLSPVQIGRAARVAAQSAAAEGRAISVADLHHGARAQNAIQLERLARRLEPAVGWSDLVLPDHVLEQLREITTRVSQRERVLDDWGMRRGGGRGEGVAGLFVGESGTGKTMAAEVIAGELGLYLYAIDLATVVSKYIGETEKNLERIFHEAEAANAVLFFDEADALFGKRSDVKDARDRYANVETAYLLQRMEGFAGVAILATNLRANLDEAFTRRLDKIVTFPTPDLEQRRILWNRCLPTTVPRSDEVDLDFCARAFQLTGGSIRNVALSAAYLAAAAGRAVSMTDVIRATEHEYHKLGRLCVEEEFGSYYELVQR
jgi:ATPase family associated with various cellular activities (AAA)